MTCRPGDDSENDIFYAMAQAIRPHVCPIFLLPHVDAGPTEIIANGTATLLDTGKRRLILTCWHVWDSFCRRRRADPSITLVLAVGDGRSPFVINDAEMIDGDHKDIDLAVLSFAPLETILATEKRFFEAPAWPPRPPAVGEVACVAGFPGHHRQVQEDKTGVTFHFTLVVDFVTSVSDRHFVLVDEGLERKERRVNASLSTLGCLGGMSGGPAFVNRKDGLELLGMIYEASEGKNATYYVAHAHFIGADGQLDRTAMPWSS